MSVPASHAKTARRRDIDDLISEELSPDRRIVRAAGAGWVASLFPQQCVQLERSPCTLTVRLLIFRRFEFGEFFLSAIDIGFMRAAEREQFLLSTDVGFGGVEFGAFAFCGGGLRSFS